MEKSLAYSNLQIVWEDFITEETPLSSLKTWEDDVVEIITAGSNIIHPQLCIRILDLQELGKKTFTVGNETFECGSIIAHQLNQSEKLALFTCSVGYGPSDQYKRYWKNNDPLKAYFTDMLGSIAVEKAMDIFQDRLKKEVETEGLFITNRYSPGYCGWEVNEQAKLFSLLPDKPCGITLTSSALMLPEKSISGIIGLGKNVRFLDYACNLCERSQCIW